MRQIKHLMVLAVFIILSLLFTSCMKAGEDMKPFKENDDAVASETVDRLISAINSKDSLVMKSVFSSSVQQTVNLEAAACTLFDLVDGNVVSHTAASEAGVAAYYSLDNGQNQKTIEFAFSLTTDKNTYHMAIRECTENDYDSACEGVLSIYVIEAGNWQEEYIYRGDGQWLPGIHVT